MCRLRHQPVQSYAGPGSDCKEGDGCEWYATERLAMEERASTRSRRVSVSFERKRAMFWLQYVRTELDDWSKTRSRAEWLPQDLFAERP